MTSFSQARLAELAKAVIAAAGAAGRVIEEVRAATTGVEVTEKADLSPVTIADKESDALLRVRLTALLPGAGWLSEETADDPSRLTHSDTWIVDPLDGTKEFIAGIPQYAVAIGLVHKGEPVIGVVHNPVSGEMFSAVRGGGAWKDDAPILVAEHGALLASRSEVKRGEFAPFTDWRLEPIGSIALKLALVASGHGAATLSRGPKWEWDVCAGSLIVREAGGRASDMFGQELRFNNPHPKVRGVLAGAPNAFARALSRLREVGESERMAELSAS